MVKFINLSVERKFFELALTMLNLQSTYNRDEKGLNNLRDKLDDPKLNNYNILSRGVFITKDLDGLVKKLGGNYAVNGGPQA